MESTVVGVDQLLYLGAPEGRTTTGRLLPKPAKAAQPPRETDKKFLETLDALEAALA